MEGEYSVTGGGKGGGELYYVAPPHRDGLALFIQELEDAGTQFTCFTGTKLQILTLISRRLLLPHPPCSSAIQA